MYTPYWRANPILKKIQDAIRDNTCGELSSLRFTWQRPKKHASDENTFVYESLAAALDGAQVLADSSLARLEIEKVPKMNIIFALVYFTNGIGAEFELNESLPDTMPDICFLKANFSHGHITNQPIVGHFNEEGMILATDGKLDFLIAENCNLPPAHGPIEQMKLRYQQEPIQTAGEDVAKLQHWIKETMQ